MKKSLILLVMIILLAAVIEAKNNPKINYIIPEEVYESTVNNMTFNVANQKSACDSSINYMLFDLGSMSAGSYINNFTDWSFIMSNDKKNVEYSTSASSLSCGLNTGEEVSFEIIAPLVSSDTNYEVEVTTKDKVDDSQKAKIKIKVLDDSLTPRILSIYPLTYSIIPNENVDINFQFEEEESGFVKSSPFIQYDDNNDEYQVSGSTVSNLSLDCNDDLLCSSDSLDPSNLIGRFIDFRLNNASDIAGNVIDQGTSFPYHLFVDKEAPVVNIVYPNDNFKTNNNSLPVDYVASDDSFIASSEFDPYLQCEVVLDDSSIVSIPKVLNNTDNNINIALNDVDDGNHKWNVECTDKAGYLSSYSSRLFSVDRKGPNIIFIASNGSILSDSSAFFLLVSDSLNDLDNVWYSYNSSSSDISLEPLFAGIYTIPTNLSDGTYDFIVSANDSFNNINSSSITIIVDTIPPVIDSMTANGSVFNKSVLLSYSVSDNHASSVSCDFSIDNDVVDSSIVNSGSSKDIARTLSDGLHSYSVECLDEVGNSILSETRYVNVDDTAPVINIISPMDYAITNSTDYSISLSASDAYGIKNCKLYVDDSVDQVNDIITSDDITFSRIWNEGNSSWNIGCTDNNYNSVLSPVRTLTIDTIAPVITILSPDSVEFQKDNISISYSVDDVNEYSQLYELYDSNNQLMAFSIIDGNVLYEKMLLKRDNYVLHMTSTDKAGNFAELFKNMAVVDNTAPQILSFSPSLNSQFDSSIENVNILVYTDEESYCRLSQSTLVWDNMTEMSNSTAFNHSFTLDVSPASSYNELILCKDLYGHSDSDEFLNLSFSVNAVPPSPPGNPSNGGGGRSSRREEVNDSIIVQQQSPPQSSINTNIVKKETPAAVVNEEPQTS